MMDFNTDISFLRGSTADATLSLTKWSISSPIMVFICCPSRTISSSDNLGGEMGASALRVATSVVENLQVLHCQS